MANVAQEAVNKAAKEFYEGFIKKSVNGETVNGFNKAINAIGNNAFGGAEFANKLLKSGNITESLGSTFGKKGADSIRSFSNGVDVGKIAGSYLGVAAAGRVVSGGGVYRDANGQANLMGVPFI
jgi:hypothetical protein